MLTSPMFDQREELVKDLYPGNELMQRKWARYGKKGVRNEIK